MEQHQGTQYVKAGWRCPCVGLAQEGGAGAVGGTNAGAGIIGVGEGNWRQAGMQQGCHASGGICDAPGLTHEGRQLPVWQHVEPEQPFAANGRGLAATMSAFFCNPLPIQGGTTEREEDGCVEVVEGGGGGECDKTVPVTAREGEEQGKRLRACASCLWSTAYCWRGHFSRKPTVNAKQ